MKWCNLAAAAAASVPRILSSHPREHDLNSQSLNIHRGRHVPTKITGDEMRTMEKYVSDGFLFVTRTNAPH
ncbi:MAG: hypothetical protein ACK559_09930, partial [bacterium]